MLNVPDDEMGIIIEGSVMEQLRTLSSKHHQVLTSLHGTNAPEQDRVWVDLALELRRQCGSVVPMFYHSDNPTYVSVTKSRLRELLKLGDQVFPGYTDFPLRLSSKEKTKIVEEWVAFKDKAEALLLPPDTSETISLVCSQLDDILSCMCDLEPNEDQWWILSVQTEALNKEERLRWRVPPKQKAGMTIHGPDLDAAVIDRVNDAAGKHFSYPPDSEVNGTSTITSKTVGKLLYDVTESLRALCQSNSEITAEQWSQFKVSSCASIRMVESSLYEKAYN
jgi:hypothetical protein